MSTTVKTGWLNDKNGDKFAPKTLTSQVQTSDGTLLEDKIRADIDAAKGEILEGMGSGTVDTELSSTSNNPVTNSTLKAEFDAVNSAIDNALPKSGGTMTGALVAQNNTNYTTKQVRNIFLVADGETLPTGANGDICLVYAP